jgi:Arc/MetJ-type ribon-helix-helix transcriptional regulator
MIAGMTTEKIAISVPEQTLARVRRAVRKGRAASVSAYITAAIEDRAKLDDLETLLAEMLQASGGPLSAAEKRAADAALLGTPKKRTKR